MLAAAARRCPIPIPILSPIPIPIDTARRWARRARGSRDRRRAQMGQRIARGRLVHLVAQYPAYARHAGHVVLIADSLVDELLLDFPGENARIFGFELPDERHDLWMGSSG